MYIKHGANYDIAGLYINSNIPWNNTQSLARCTMLILAMLAKDRNTDTEI